MKAEVGVLGVWDELSRILPDHTFLTETRLADGKVTLSGFSADAARLVRIIDQSPLFSGAALTARSRLTRTSARTDSASRSSCGARACDHPQARGVRHDRRLYT